MRGRELSISTGTGTIKAYNSTASAVSGIRAVTSLADDAAIEDQTTSEPLPWRAAIALAIGGAALLLSRRASRPNDG